MEFSAEDLDTILAATGEDVVVKTSGGAVVKTIQGKFRKDFEDVSPYGADVATLVPAVIVKTADLAGIGSSHILRIAGTDYKMGTPEDLSNGFTRIRLNKG